jgi:PAS domain S-box-containing protein
MQEKFRKGKENANFITLLNFIADPAVIVDENGLFLAVNKAFENVTGLSRKNLVNTPFSNVKSLSIESRKILLQNLKKRMKGAGPEPYEITFSDTNGEKRVSEVKAKKITYAGHPADLVLFHDVTRRKRNERRLREYSEKMEALVNEKVKEIKESEAKYRELINSMNDTAWVIDLDAKFVDVNDAAVRVLGYSRKELLSMGPADIDASLTVEQIRDLVRRMPADQVQIFETTHTTKAGKIIPVEISSSLVTYQGKQAVLSIARDITERKKSEEALKESEEKFRNLSEESPNMIFIYKHGRVVYANKKCEDLMGYTKEEFYAPTFNFLSIIAPESRKKLNMSYAKHKGGEEVDPYEYTLVTKAGKRINAVITSKLIRYEGETSILGIITDITERKRAEKALKESEERAKAIIVNAPIGIATSSPDKHFLSANEAFCKILGYTEAELRKLTFKDITHPSDLKESVSRMKQLEEGKLSSFKQEKRYLKKDGSMIYGKIMVSAVQDQAGKPSLFIAELEDITEQKKAEQNLSKSEKKYRRLFEELKKAEKQLLEERDRAQNYLDVASVILLALNTKGHITLLNRKGCEVLKCRAKNALGKNWFDNFVPENVRGNVKQIFNLLIAGKAGMPEYNENYVLSKNGEMRLIAWHNTVLKNSSGQIIGTLSSGEDITEKKKIENDLKLERDKLEAVTENIGAGLGIFSKDFRILWANKLLKQLNGECEGKKCYSTFNKLRDVCPDCGVKKVFETGVLLDVHEYSNLDDKGNRFWIELIVTPIKDEKGNITSALELAVNITERKLMQNKLAEYSQKLEKLVEKRTKQLRQTQAKLVKSERLAAIGELAAMVGHDLRNPLTGIKGAAYYLNSKYRGEISNVGKAMLTTIDECIEHSNKIINDLLDYSRDLKLELSETTPKALLARSLAMLKVPKKVKVINKTGDKPAVTVDAARMTRVLLNILQNAVDAMPDGGTLTLASKTVKGNLQISIADTGTGMSKKTIAKLWTPLFTTKAKGMGFGLSICKRIVEAHKGEISVKSKIGKGSTFTVTIPLHPTPAQEKTTMVFSEPALSASAQAPKPA